MIAPPRLSRLPKNNNNQNNTLIKVGRCGKTKGMKRTIWIKKQKRKTVTIQSEKEHQEYIEQFNRALTY